MENSPIGIFDSGIGGSGILAACANLMPHESFVYVADNLKAPYGKRSRATIQKRMRTILIDLIENHRIKAFVIACNTASSVGKQKLRSEFSLPIVAVEPPLKMVKKEDSCLILATRHTLRCKRIRTFLHKRKNAQSLAIPSLAIKIDKTLGEFDKLTPFLHKKLDKFAHEGIQSLVLGCTHYHFIERQLQDVFPQTAILSAEKAVAKQVKHVLAEKNLLTRRNNGKLQVVLTKQNDKMERYIQEYYRFALPPSSSQQKAE